jgi:hypothetical protein
MDEVVHGIPYTNGLRLSVSTTKKPLQWTTTEALASKTCTLCRGEYLHSRASKLSSFTRRPQAGYCRRKLTTSGGASGFAISARRLASFQISAN